MSKSMKTKERSATCWKMMQIREARGYNHEDMAEFLGTSASTYQRLESGQTVLSVERLARIAEVLHVDLPFLLSEQPVVCLPGKGVKEPGITVQGAQKDWDRARAFGLALGVSEGVILSLAPEERGRAQGLLDEARSLWDKHLTTP